MKYITDIYNEKASRLGYGKKQKMEIGQYSFHFGRTHPHIVTLLCVENGFPGNIIYNIFNEIEAIEALEDFQINEENKNLVLPYFIRVYENYKTVKIKENVNIENFEITHTETVINADNIAI